MHSRLTGCRQWFCHSQCGNLVAVNAVAVAVVDADANQSKLGEKSKRERETGKEGICSWQAHTTNSLALSLSHTYLLRLPDQANKSQTLRCLFKANSAYHYYNSRILTFPSPTNLKATATELEIQERAKLWIHEVSFKPLARFGSFSLSPNLNILSQACSNLDKGLRKR